MKIKEIPSFLYNLTKYHVAKCYIINLYYMALASLPAKKIKKKRPDNLPIIVSLTSIPYRLGKVHMTVRSLLYQKGQPEKIVLWLHESLKNHIPNSLKILKGDIFEIRYTSLYCPHKKLVPSLEHFADKIIVTVDDDIIYHKNCTTVLYKTHLNHPDCIIANRSRPIRYDADKNVLPYKEWTYRNDETDKDCTILAIGVTGVLYPPKCLDKRVFNSELFLKLSPKADDLWFKAMAMLHHTEVIQTKNSKNPILTVIVGTQKVCLEKENVTQDKNRTQWEQLINYFNLKP